VTTRWWSAPAKLNLFLHINGQRADKYHEIQTHFQLLAVGDRLAFEPLDGARVERVLEPLGTAGGDPAAASLTEPAAALSRLAPDADLTVRAARLLQSTAAPRAGVRIRLRKQLPLGGGLGGGSSNAATTLRVLDRLWGTGLGTHRLAELGHSLGADVPVFVHGQSAFGEGTGERLTPLNGPDAWYVVVHPGVAVSTREVFQASELTRNSPVITIRALSQTQTRNDCERVVRARHPEVSEALDWLAQYAPSRLTGTGACVFAAFASAAAAERVAARVPDAWRALVSPGVQSSPLLAELAASDDPL
jgi:4-diphosphocytidyl-2-C-methyl-D-erythritol kinase